ncbi:hypothetical protein A1OU_15680 [Enterovibrio norvegicus]|nr:hypothetical protein A1OU_15680 [Enterovibrio norvegicus]
MFVAARKGLATLAQLGYKLHKAVFSPALQTNSPNRLLIVPFMRTIKSNNAQLSTNQSFDKIIFIVTHGASLLLTYSKGE